MPAVAQLHQQQKDRALVALVAQLMAMQISFLMSRPTRRTIAEPAGSERARPSRRPAAAAAAVRPGSGGSRGTTRPRRARAAGVHRVQRLVWTPAVKSFSLRRPVYFLSDSLQKVRRGRLKT